MLRARRNINAQRRFTKSLLQVKGRFELEKGQAKKRALSNRSFFERQLRVMAAVQFSILLYTRRANVRRNSTYGDFMIRRRRAFRARVTKVAVKVPALGGSRGTTECKISPCLRYYINLGAM